MKILINTNNNYYITPICRCLRLVAEKYNFEVETNTSIPPYSIWMDNKPIAYLAHRDSYKLWESDERIINAHNYKIIFKYHFSPKMEYGKYSDKVISCGLYRWLPFQNIVTKQDLLINNRWIDVQARMRCRNSNPNSPKTTWAGARRIIVSEANKLKTKGYNIRAGDKVSTDKYTQELYHSKLGFIWSATSYLGWKIPEFIQCGVVMVTEPLGKNFPIREDIILEDNIHCIFCNDPNQFGIVAEELLKDTEKLEGVRKNVVDLWFDKLCPEKMGEWYYRKMLNVL